MKSETSCRLLLVILVFLVPFLLFSQGKKGENSTPDKKKLILSVVETDSLPKNLSDYLKSTTSKHFQDPSLPRFVIKDRTDDFVFGVGGYVSARGYYDYSNNSATGYVVSSIEVPTNKWSGDVMNVDPGGTRLFFKLLGRTKLGIINAYIETDFLNQSQFMRLRHAYVEMAGLKIGKSWSTYKDVESPNTIDGQGPVSLSGRRVPLISYTYTFKNRLKLSAAAEFSQSVSATIPSGDTIGYSVYKVSQSYPDFPMTVSYTNERLHIFGAVSIRMMKFTELRNMFTPRLSYSAQISGNYSFYHSERQNHKFYAHMIYADGMTDCIQDLNGIGLNIVVARAKTMNMISTMSAFAFHVAYQAAWGVNEINAIYSRAKLLNSSLKFGYKDLYHTGDYLALNYLRKVLTYGVVGVELLGGKRTNINGQCGLDFRINLLVRYDF